MTNLDSIFKSRDITLPTKVRLVEAMVFPVVMYGCQSWTVKKAERQRIDAFELWCWRRLLSPSGEKHYETYERIGTTQALRVRSQSTYKTLKSTHISSAWRCETDITT